MTNKVKHQVFINSTFTDLQKERWAVLRALLKTNCAVSGMDFFPTIDMEKFEYIKQIINDCDYYVLILDGRYGTLAEDGQSFMEKEYDYACSKNIPVIAFPYKNPDELPSGKRETKPYLIQKFQAFRKKVCSGRFVSFWQDMTELRLCAMEGYIHAAKIAPATGWIRANVAASEDLLQEVNELRKSNEVLRQKIQALERTAHPLLSDFVTLGDTFTLEGKYVTESLKMAKLQADFTWQTIFLAVAPRANDWTAFDELGNEIAQELLQPKMPPGGGFLKLSPSVLEIALCQLVTLDLLDIQMRGAEYYCKLTPLGKRVMVGRMVGRTAGRMVG